MRIQEASSDKCNNIILIDRPKLFWNRYIENASVKINAYKSKLNFFVTKLKNYDAVLDITWLKKHNLRVN